MLPTIYSKKGSVRKKPLPKKCHENTKDILYSTRKLSKVSNKKELRDRKIINVFEENKKNDINENNAKFVKTMSLHDIASKKQSSFYKTIQRNEIELLTSKLSSEKEKKKNKNQRTKNFKWPTIQTTGLKNFISDFNSKDDFIYENVIDFKPLINTITEDPLDICNETLKPVFSSIKNINTSLQFFSSFNSDMIKLKGCTILINTFNNSGACFRNTSNIILVSSENYGQIFLIDHSETKKLKNLENNLKAKIWFIHISKKFLFSISSGHKYCLKWRLHSA
ncbi:hypothetical protein QEN19_004229 [Hanseniaspora menglaensis]